MSEGRKKLLLVDGNSLMNRAFYALPRFKTASGRPTNAVYGFIRMVYRLLGEERPDYVVVAFDRRAPTFRHLEYEGYKAQRTGMPDELSCQVPLLKEVIDALGLRICELDGYEADDIIATLAAAGEEKGLEVVIVTGDRDALQLVSPAVKVIMTRRGISDVVRYDEETVRAEYGVEPSSLLDVKGLTGDASDNLPGVKGIGEKTALKLIGCFGSLEALLDRLSEVEDARVRKALEGGREQALMTKRLATVLRDAPVARDLESYVRGPADVPRLKRLFEELEFKSLTEIIESLRREAEERRARERETEMAGAASGVEAPLRAGVGEVLPERGRPGGLSETAGPSGAAREAGEAGEVGELGRVVGTTPGPGGSSEKREPGTEGLLPAEPGPKAATSAPLSERVEVGEPRGPRMVMVDAERPDVGALEELMADVGQIRKVSVAGCVEGKPATAGRLVGLAVCPAGKDVAYYVPGDAWARGSASGQLQGFLRRIFGESGVAKAGHEVKPLLAYLGSRGLERAGFAFDTAIAAYLLDPTRASYELGSLLKEHGGPRVDVEAGSPGRGKSKVPPSDLHGRRIGELLCLRAWAVNQIWVPMRKAVSEAGMDYLLEEVEMPLCLVLADMEIAGVAADADRLRDLGKEFGASIERVASEIYAMAGEEFNINSTRQLGEVLFGKLKLPVVKKTKTGHSTDSEVLETLAAHHDIALKILEYRQLQKLKGTYVDGLTAVIDPKTGRVHSTFHQTVTATGRISSSEPNLQNIPVRMEMGRRIRGVFVAQGKEKLLVSGDYSQIELRVMAHLSQDPILMESFHKGEDIHARTASEVFGVPLEQVTPEMRSRAKAVNFGIIYGMSDFGLARDIGVSRTQAKEYIEGYFARYSGVKAYIDRVLEEARQTGYVKTILNRRRPMQDLNSRNPTLRRFAERTAMNTPIQGSAADIIKMAMVRIHRRLNEQGMASRMVLQVHDELIFEAPKDEVEALCQLIRREMEGVYELRVPLKVDLKAGADWYHMLPCG